jgi:hypothetical protein
MTVYALFLTFAYVAQLVEQCVEATRVSGSIPFVGTNNLILILHITAMRVIITYNNNYGVIYETRWIKTKKSF